MQSSALINKELDSLLSIEGLIYRPYQILHRFSHKSNGKVEDLGMVRSYDKDATLPNSLLTECGCYSELHDRSKPGNTRTKIETLLLKQVNNKYKLDSSLNILSLGSGGFLQDLVIITKLIKQGYKSLNITLIEPDYYDKAYQEFVAHLEKIKKAMPELSLTWHFHESIDRIEKKSDPFDIVYAIDYDDYYSVHDFSKRNKTASLKLLTDMKEPDESEKMAVVSYDATMALIKSINKMKDAKSEPIALLSKGKDVLDLTHETTATLHGHPHIGYVLPNEKEVKGFYLNSNVCHLIYNISYFSKSCKRIFINENIIRSEDKIALEEFLKRYDLDYQFIDENNVSEMTSYIGKERLVVLDYTPHSESVNKNKSDSIPLNLQKENIHVLQMNPEKVFQVNICNAFSLYPPLDSAKKLILTSEIDEKFIKNVDEKIMRKIAKTTGLSAKKAAYLSNLNEEIQGQSDDFKKAFATYLLNTDHFLKMDRRYFLWNSYSMQTRSVQTAIFMLLQPIIPIIDNKKLLLNNEILTRHIPELAKKFTY